METQTKNFSEMNLPQLFNELRSINPDYLASISESEMLAAYQRCEAVQSRVIRFLRKPWVLFLYSLVIVSLVGVVTFPQPDSFYMEGLGLKLLIGFWVMCAFCLSGVIHLFIKALSEWTGMDKAAWVMNQMRILSLSSSARTRCKELEERYPECAQYQLHLLLRGRELRLLDLGVMVYLSNTGKVLRAMPSS